ncbi:MAG: hypothetical protein U9M95_04380 [Candidatus Altiarchaeota archaeon]|nr:hypothetical protein [Candidatus Altiarchaeota archaeon]
MSRLLPSDKIREWYLDEMREHVVEISELLKRGDEIYRGDKTCGKHARTEAYDLIVLTAELFALNDVLDSVPDEIIERFNQKRR